MRFSHITDAEKATFKVNKDTKAFDAKGDQVPPEKLTSVFYPGVFIQADVRLKLCACLFILCAVRVYWSSFTYSWDMNGADLERGSKTYQLALEQIGILHVPASASATHQSSTPASSPSPLKRKLDAFESPRPFVRLADQKTIAESTPVHASSSNVPSSPSENRKSAKKAKKGRAEVNGMDVEWDISWAD
jgi:hypothetical protein